MAELKTIDDTTKNSGCCQNDFASEDISLIIASFCVETTFISSQGRTLSSFRSAVFSSFQLLKMIGACTRKPIMFVRSRDQGDKMFVKSLFLEKSWNAF